LVAPKIQNWPLTDLLRNVDGLVVGMVLWLANLCYSGIHAAAWKGHFPNEAEKWLWPASASYIGVCGGLWVVLNFAVSGNPILNTFWEHWMGREEVVDEEPRAGDRCLYLRLQSRAGEGVYYRRGLL
jgi:hypothetical protein